MGYLNYLDKLKMVEIDSSEEVAPVLAVIARTVVIEGIEAVRDCGGMRLRPAVYSNRGDGCIIGVIIAFITCKGGRRR